MHYPFNHCFYYLFNVTRIYGFFLFSTMRKWMLARKFCFNPFHTNASAWDTKIPYHYSLMWPVQHHCCNTNASLEAMLFWLSPSDVVSPNVKLLPFYSDPWDLRCYKKRKRSLIYIFLRFGATHLCGVWAQKGAKNSTNVNLACRKRWLRMKSGGWTGFFYCALFCRLCLLLLFCPCYDSLSVWSSALIWPKCRSSCKTSTQSIIRFFKSAVV